MADFDLSWNWGCWAKTLLPFTSWSIVVRLFLHITAKQHLNHHCAPILVRFRISLFPKSCHALDRSCFAGHNELWIIKNGGIFWELHWFKAWHSNMFLFSSLMMARFSENGCWNIVVHCLLSWLVCLIQISGKIVREQDEWWTLYNKP